MKTLYTVNKIVFIINLILAFIPFAGLLFMMITGAVQVTSYMIYLTKWKQIHPVLRNYFILYPFLVGITCSILAIGKDITFIISLSIATLIAICFLYITYRQNKYVTHEL